MSNLQNPDATVIPSTSDAAAFSANASAIDDLVHTMKYRHIVAWGKWLGFTPRTVQKHVLLAEQEDAPSDVVQKIDGIWIRIGDVVNDANRNRVEGIARKDGL